MAKEQVTIADLPVTKVDSEAELLESLCASGDKQEIFWFPVNENLEWFFSLNRKESAIEVFCHDIGVSGIARTVSLLLRDKIREALPGAYVHDFVFDYNSEMNKGKGLGLFHPGANAPIYTREQAVTELNARMHLGVTERANIPNR